MITADRTDRDPSWSKELSPLLFLVFTCCGLPKFLVHAIDEAEDLISSHFFNGARNKMLRQELPGLAHFCEEGFDIGGNDALSFFVGFGEDEAEGDLPFSKLVDEFQIDLLG